MRRNAPVEFSLPSFGSCPLTMWFRNLQIFRLTSDWAHGTDALSAALHKGIFHGCGATDRVARGWVPPRDEGELVFSVAHQQLIALGIEQKLLPASVVRQYAQAKLVEIEAAQGYKPGRKQSREVIDQVETELLPRAFVKRCLTYVWIDPVNRWLLVDASSSTRADEVMEHLKLSLGELPVTLIKTRIAPATAMTQWLAAGQAPGNFTIDRDCELAAWAIGWAWGDSTTMFRRVPIDSTSCWERSRSPRWLFSRCRASCWRSSTTPHRWVRTRRCDTCSRSRRSLRSRAVCTSGPLPLPSSS